jgi:hypothetical protein
MSGSLPWSPSAPAPVSNDPNEILRRIDATTTQMFHWVRIGFIVTIVLLVVAILIG